MLRTRTILIVVNIFMFIMVSATNAMAVDYYVDPIGTDERSHRTERGMGYLSITSLLSIKKAEPQKVKFCLWYKKAPRVGLEPTTKWLTATYSTIELSGN